MKSLMIISQNIERTDNAMTKRLQIPNGKSEARNRKDVQYNDKSFGDTIRIIRSHKSKKKQISNDKRFDDTKRIIESQTLKGHTI